jgi:integrase/recombinase XerD
MEQTPDNPNVPQPQPAVAPQQTPVWLSQNPMAIKRTRESKPRKLPIALNYDEFLKILDATKHSRHKLAFKLSFLCGLRVSEIVKLKQENIDYGRRLLFIQQSKGKKDRYVPFPEKFAKDLKQVPLEMGARALEIAFKKALQKAEITKDAHFHTLRHSSATYYLSNGMNIVQVQQLLGHSRLDTTSIYLHVSPDNVKNEMDRIWG